MDERPRLVNIPGETLRSPSSQSFNMTVRPAICLPMSAISRIRRRYVTTIPRLSRERVSVKVGDDVLWLPVSDREFLAVVLSGQRYKALSQLIGNIKLSREARRVAERAYLERAGVESP